MLYRPIVLVPIEETWRRRLPSPNPSPRSTPGLRLSGAGAHGSSLPAPPPTVSPRRPASPAGRSASPILRRQRRGWFGSRGVSSERACRTRTTVAGRFAPSLAFILFALCGSRYFLARKKLRNYYLVINPAICLIKEVAATLAVSYVALVYAHVGTGGGNGPVPPAVRILTEITLEAAATLVCIMAVVICIL